MNDADGGWLWRYRAVTEIDSDGRQLFRFHRRFSQHPFGHLDVLLAVSMAVAIVGVSDALTLKVDRVELYLRPDDAFRLGPELIVDTDWPKWSSAAEVVDGEPEADADLTVVLVGR